MNEEIEVLSCIYPEKIKHDGKNQVTIKLIKDELSLEISFVLPEKYPDQLPEIFVRSHSVPEYVEKWLKSKAEELLGTPMLFTLVSLAEEEFLTKEKTNFWQDVSVTVFEKNDTNLIEKSDVKFGSAPMSYEDFTEWWKQKRKEKRKSISNVNKPMTGKDYFISKFVPAGDILDIEDDIIEISIQDSGN